MLTRNGTLVIKLKDDAKYIPPAEYYASPLKQGFFLSRCAAILGPDTYINDVLIMCSIVPKAKELRLAVG